MDSQTKVVVQKYATGAAVAALGGALAALMTMLEAGPVTDPKALGIAVLVGAVAALRLWTMKQASSLPSIFGVTKSFGDKLAAPPDEEFGEGGILYRVTLPAIEEPPALRAFGFIGGVVPAAPSVVEVRKFTDPKLQEAVEQVFRSSGGRSGMFFNVNLNGEIRSGVAIKAGGHLSIGGFFIKKPGVKMEALAEVTYSF